jgi:hypothetical protein
MRLALAAVITLGVFSLMLTLAMSPAARQYRAADQGARSVPHPAPQHSIR